MIWWRWCIGNSKNGLFLIFLPQEFQLRVCTATPSPQQKVGKAPPPLFFPEGDGGLAQATVISHEKEKLVKFITYNM